MTQAPVQPPCFAFGRGQATLALMGGGLILDSGEAENTFAFRCQDRFLAYNTLLGLRSVLLVLDGAHEARLRSLVAQLNARLRMLSEWQGLPPPQAAAPLHLRCDLASLGLSARGAFEAEAAALARTGQSVGFIANQVSPTVARMLGTLAGLLRERGVPVEFDAGACTRMGRLALDWHNKAHFLAQRPALQACGLPWADSAVLPARELLAQPHWQALAARVAREWNLSAPPAELFLKSAQDSSGNVSAIVSPQADAASNPGFLAEVRRWLLAEDFAAPAHLRELRAECELAPSLEGVRFSDHLLAVLRAQQAQRRGGIALIAQPVLRPPAGAGGRPAGIGISLLVDDSGSVRLVAANAQLYRDAQHRQFLGILLDDGLLHDEAVARFARQCTDAAAVLAGQGLRGPVNFDGCLAPDGRYWFTGDCNPRLTALYVPLAVRMRLAACGVDAKRVMSFGYRGEIAIADPPATLGAWADAGLLFGARTQRGMLVLPNLARRAGHDLLAVNLDRAQAGDALRRMRLLAPDSVPAHLESIHG